MRHRATFEPVDPHEATGAGTDSGTRTGTAAGATSTATGSDAGTPTASKTSRRAFLGAAGGAVVVAGGAAFVALGPFADEARALILGGSAAGSGGTGDHRGHRSPSASPSATDSATPTPSATATPTPTATDTPTPSATEEPTAAPTATPSATADATTMPVDDVVSNGVTWTPVFTEDFDTDAALGSVLSTYPRMGAYNGYKDTSGYGLYAPDRVLSVSDSVLDFHLRTENGQALVSSVLPDDYAPHQYGRVSIRYRADSIQGYKFVGMLWPSSNDWNDGEIDWPEGDLDGKVRPASEVVGGVNPLTGGRLFLPVIQYFAPTTQSDFHIATTEWTAGVVRFYWDGALIATVTTGVPTKPMRVTLQAETWIDGGAVPASADGHLQIDWVVIYEQA